MKKYVLTMLLIVAATMTSCNSQQKQAGQADAADSTAVDSSGAVVEKQYDFEAIAKAIEGCTYLYRFEDGVAFVRKGDETFYIDLQGRRVGKPEEKVDSTKLTTDYEDGLFGFKDHEGKLVIPRKFHYAHNFSDGMAIVVNEKGLVGYINTKGELAIPYQYDTMAESDGNDFHEGLCAVVVNGSHEWVSYVDKTGKQAFEGVFSYGGDFSEGLAAVTTTGENSRSGYVDHSGKMVIELPEGWWGRKFSDGVAQTQRVDSCYIIDKTGRRLFQVKSDIIYPGNDIVYSEGLAVVYGRGKYEKKVGFMDKTGRITFCLGHSITDAELVFLPDLANTKPLDLSDGKDEAAKLFPVWDEGDVYEDEGVLHYDLNLGYDRPLQQLYKALPGKPIDKQEVNRVILIDLNKDGYTDALVCLGRYGSEKTLYFDAYIWDEEEYGGLFTFVENFRQIPNPRIDKENSNIIGLNGNNSEVWVWKGKDKIEKSQVKRD